MSLLGERLRQEREQRGISVLQVEIDTRIRATVIEALEQGAYASLPPEPFLRGLVRSYATYLRMDAEDALNLLGVDLLAQLTARAPLTNHAASPSPNLVNSPERFESSPDQSQTFEPDTSPTGWLQPLVSLLPIEWNSLWRQSKLSLPLVIAVITGGIVILVICAVLVFVRISINPTTSAGARGNATVTRTLTTLSQTATGPTSIPMLALTAAPFPTFPGNATPTARVIPRRTLEVRTGLNLDLDANEQIKVLVGVDNVPVFNGVMEPGTTRSWSAQESLYFRVENAKDANIYFNGRDVLAANFAERTLMERRWVLNERGTPVRTTPSTPVVPTLTRTITPTPIHTITPTSFDTPTRPAP